MLIKYKNRLFGNGKVNNNKINGNENKINKKC